MIDFDYLLRKQSELNKAAGRDTEEMGGIVCHIDVFSESSPIRERFQELFYDYYLALMDELNELKNCVIWKHWCTEAKEGRRWEIAERQNAEVEVIDILFFILSLSQICNVVLDYPKIPPTLDLELDPPGKLLVYFTSVAQSLCGPTELVNPREARHFVGNQLWYWFYFVQILGLTDEQVMNLYNNKWEINMTRIQRGRLQIGDPLSEAENASVTSENSSECKELGPNGNSTNNS